MLKARIGPAPTVATPGLNSNMLAAEDPYAPVMLIVSVAASTKFLNPNWFHCPPDVTAKVRDTFALPVFLRMSMYREDPAIPDVGSMEKFPKTGMLVEVTVA